MADGGGGVMFTVHLQHLQHIAGQYAVAADMVLCSRSSHQQHSSWSEGLLLLLLLPRTSEPSGRRTLLLPRKEDICSIELCSTAKRAGQAAASSQYQEQIDVSGVRIPRGTGGGCMSCHSQTAPSAAPP